MSAGAGAMPAEQPDADDRDWSPLDQAWRRLRSLPADPDRAPDRTLIPGAVGLVGHRGRIGWRRAGGWARCYADSDGGWLPETDRVPVHTDTLFDIASVTKLFTSIVIMCLVEAGTLQLDRAVAAYLPEFARDGDAAEAGGDKAAVTVRQLLTHTSGFPAKAPLWRDHPDPPSRRHAALTAGLESAPGSTYRYSDLNLITLGQLAHRVDGRGLDRLVAELICRPLGMADTGYRPVPEPGSRFAATEVEHDPPRGLVCGEVHDENAWSLDGVAGHAGIFSTAEDLAVLAQMILNHGSYRGHRIVRPETVRQMLTNQTPQFPGDDHGLGFELNQPRYMGRLAGPDTCGHTGFTGTSVVIDPERRAFVILLTNRVHPSRYWGGVNLARSLFADAVAETLDRQ